MKDNLNHKISCYCCWIVHLRFLIRSKEWRRVRGKGRWWENYSKLTSSVLTLGLAFVVRWWCVVVVVVRQCCWWSLRSRSCCRIWWKRGWSKRLLLLFYLTQCCRMNEESILWDPKERKPQEESKKNQSKNLKSTSPFWFIYFTVKRSFTAIVVHVAIVENWRRHKFILFR